eukprot:Gb_36728 [translate_table: standard]
MLPAGREVSKHAGMLDCDNAPLKATGMGRAEAGGAEAGDVDMSITVDPLEVRPDFSAFGTKPDPASTEDNFLPPDGTFEGRSSSSLALSFKLSSEQLKSLTS